MMTKGIYRLLSGLLLIIGSSQTALAQNVYNPTNPPEPQMYYKLTTSVNISGAGYTSGSGKYKEGDKVRINTSAYQNYTFAYWTLNGVHYSDERSFYYTMGHEMAEFVAHYSFTPSNPQEPALNLKNRLYLTSSPEGCCSFNRTSGEKFFTDNYISVNVYANQGYEFIGWYEKGKLVSKVKSFSYYMTGDQNVTLEARFVYNPVSPGDPSSTGNDPTYLVGDVDKDKVVDVTDAVIVNDHFIKGTTHELKSAVADVNRDGVMDVSDVVEIIQKYLNKR